MGNHSGTENYSESCCTEGHRHIVKQCAHANQYSAFQGNNGNIEQNRVIGDFMMPDIVD